MNATGRGCRLHTNSAHEPGGTRPAHGRFPVAQRPARSPMCRRHPPQNRPGPSTASRRKMRARCRAVPATGSHRPPDASKEQRRYFYAPHTRSSVPACSCGETAATIETPVDNCHDRTTLCRSRTRLQTTAAAVGNTCACIATISSLLQLPSAAQFASMPESVRRLASEPPHPHPCSIHSSQPPCHVGVRVFPIVTGGCVFANIN